MGQLQQNCPSQQSCKTCNRRHHYLLHRTDSRQIYLESPANEAQALCSRSQVTHTTTLLNTALVSIVSGCFQTNTRTQEQLCLSLVTSRLAKTLKAKKDPLHLPSQALVVVFMVTSQFSLLCSMPITPFSCSSPCLVPDVPAQDLHFLTSQPFLQDKELANSYFDSMTHSLEWLTPTLTSFKAAPHLPITLA